MESRPPHSEDRWRSRRLAAGLLRALILLVPIGAGFGVGWMVASALPSPTTSTDVAFWWIAIVAVSTVSATAVDRLARQLLPLAALLQMTMLFPDAAPSRLRTARRAGNVSELRKRIVEAGREGANSDIGEMAEMVLSLSTALTNHDRRTRGHSERTRVYTDLIAEEMGLAEPDRDRLRWAALLHDVGKLEVPAEILNKDSALDDAEWAVVKEHPVHGMRLVAPLVPWLGGWARTIEHHHERYDGTGYPHGLAGDAICLGARIVTVADAYDVMTSGRSYKTAMTPAAARAEIASMAGVQFDPVVARALMNVSLGKLRWSAGPLAAMAQIPFIRGLPQIGRDLAMVLTTSAVLTTGFVSGVIATPDGMRTTPTELIEVLVAGDAIQQSVIPAPRNDSFPVAAEAPWPGDALALTDDAGIPPADPEMIESTTASTAPSPPTARNDVATTDEDTPVTIAVLANDDDPDDDLDPTSLAIVTGPANGSAVVSGSSIRYTPDRDFNGSDSLNYRICDTGGRCASATVSITVVAINDPPLAPAGSAATDAGVAISVPLGYSDPDGDTLTCTLAASPSVGAATVPANCDPLLYSPPTTFGGGVTVTIQVSDGTVAVTGTVTITVTAVASVTATDDSASVRPNDSVNLSLTANDTGPIDPTTLQVGGASGGTVTVLGSSGRVRFDAAPGFTGTATFSYTICGTDGTCANALVTIEVG
ncbi:MAG TPA: HD domain-containing phosphohydrolase [Acidimicrobiia bacterium]|nr:HD domain-containing phosphohydrolase [Acidimicrobiia bacterium]